MNPNLDTKVLKITKNKKDDKSPTKRSEEDESPQKIPAKMSKLIIRLRNEKQITLKELATKASIDTATLSNWENGKGYWNKKHGDKISKALGIKLSLLEDLLKESTDKK